MILRNAEIFDKDFRLVRADIAVEGDRIAKVGPDLHGKDEVDCSGCLITPGFVDIHIHGCAGADTCDGKRESVAAMAAHLVRQGVTSFCPTTMTVPLPQIEAALAAVRDCMENPPEGAAVLGANMEGPYISEKRLGAQKKEAVRKPDWQEFERLNQNCGGIVRLVDMAPECEGAEEFIRRISRSCCVSIAHTDAGYEQAKASFGWGVTHATHLFNAMNGLNHRAPGVVGAVFDDPNVRAEIICDGFHIHPAVLRIAFRILGENRTVVISDSMRAAGLPDGISELGGQKVYIKDGHARLADGTIAGSTTNLLQEIQNLVRFGVPLRQAVQSATINPAREVGAEDETGSICAGKYADLAVLDGGLGLRFTVARGRVFRRQTAGK